MARKSEIIAVVPARYGSTRLPGKPLLNETGRPLIRHVVDAARKSKRVDRVIVATDDRRILDAVVGFGGEAMLTRADCASGTDRVAEVAAAIPEASIVVNVQGDEPEIEGESIDLLVDLLVEADPTIAMATLATPIFEPAVFHDASCVKVVTSKRGTALYFSRSPIPYDRDGSIAPGTPLGHLHLGLYAYRRDFLTRYAAMPPTPLEMIEKLEQLRALETGATILVGIVNRAAVGIDTPEDYKRFVERYRASEQADEQSSIL